MAKLDLPRWKDQWKDARPRTNAIAALDVWYDHQLLRGHKRLLDLTNRRPGEPDVPDELVRSETFIGPSAGRPDGTTAWGVESEEPGRSKPPRGWSTYIDVVSRDEAEWIRQQSAARQEVIEIMVPAMQRLGIINPPHMITLEMRAAGWSWQAIAHAFDASRQQVSIWWECGLTWIGGCLVVKPDFTAGFERKPRRMLKADL